MSRIFLLSLLVTTAVVIVLSCCDGAPMHPKFELRKFLRAKRGIFGQISSTVPSTNAPRVFIGNSRRKSTTKITTTTTLKTIISDSEKSTTTTSLIQDPTRIQVENLQSAKPIIDDEDKTMEDEIVTIPKSTTTLSPVYLHDQPSAQRLHQKETTIPSTMPTSAPVSSTTTTEEVPQVSQNEVSSTTAVETSSRKFEDDARDKAGVANNRGTQIEILAKQIWQLVSNRKISGEVGVDVDGSDIDYA